MFDYKVIKSKRKTAAIQVKNGKVIVRVPTGTDNSYVTRLVRNHENWVYKQLARQSAMQKRSDALEPLFSEDIQKLARQALDVIPKRVGIYAEMLGVSYGKITVRNQKTRWGSCNSKGDLSFNCLLMLTPLEVLDSVVVHELCHRKEMNHSDKFYKEVLSVYPDYYKWHGWLKKNGPILIKRMEMGKNEI